MDSDRPADILDRTLALKASVALLDHARKIADASVDRLSRKLEGTHDKQSRDIALFTLELRSVINDIEEQSLQSIVDTTPIRRATASRANLERRTIEAVLGGTEWLTGDEVGQRHNPNARNKHAAVSRWLSEGKVFAIERAGQRFFPAYAFDELWNPRPAIATVLDVFEGYTPFRVASWFESINAFLGGKRPRDVISVDPDVVLEAVRDHVTGPIHG